MAKTLIYKGSDALSSDSKRNFADPVITGIADLTATDALNKATICIVTAIAGHGRCVMELFDKNSVSQFVVNGPFLAGGASLLIWLSTEAGAAAAGSAHDLSINRGNWIVDAASFATGLITVQLTGDLNVRIQNQVLSPFGDVYTETRDSAGVWPFQIPFTVTE